MQRTEFVIYKGQDSWLENVGEKYGAGQQFIARRAVNYYINVVWEDGQDDGLVSAANDGYYGQLSRDKSSRKHMEMPDDQMDWIRAKSDELGVAMSYLFRRALKKYKEDVISGEWNDPVLNEV